MRCILVYFLLTFFFQIDLYCQEYCGSDRISVKYDLKEQFDSSKYKLEFNTSIRKIDTAYKFDISQKELDRKIKSFGKYYVDSLSTIPSVIDRIDTLLNLNVKISGSDSIDIVYFFGEWPFYMCDSIVIKYYRDSFSKKNLKFLLKDKNRKWKKLTKDRYISCFQSLSITDHTDYSKTKLGSLQMFIERPDLKNDFTTVLFYTPLLDKEEWLKLTK